MINILLIRFVDHVHYFTNSSCLRNTNGSEYNWISVGKIIEHIKIYFGFYLSFFVNQSFYAMDTVYNFGAGPAKM